MCGWCCIPDLRLHEKGLAQRPHSAERIYGKYDNLCWKFEIKVLKMYSTAYQYYRKV
jgi:hypothetical protein